MSNDPDVAWFEPDFTLDMPNPQAIPQRSGQIIPWSVTAVGGEQSWTRSGNGHGWVHVDVFVLDTGVANASSSDPNDDLYLYHSIDFRDHVARADAKDHDGHGTHIAGIIGAIDDYDTVVGIAPGARIHNYKVLNDEGGTDVSVTIAAIEHIIQLKKAQPWKPMVVNMSLGENVGSSNYTALDQAIKAGTAEGIVFVVAAGNHGINVANISPAHTAEVITVGSHNVNNKFSSFSNYGPLVDILAPGEDILSLAPGGTMAYMTGTSMATAHVTGAAAPLSGTKSKCKP